MESLPIVDMSPMFQGTSLDGVKEVATQIGHAARSIGFFYLTGHGVDPALLQAVYAQSADFFALPEAEKEKLSIAKVGNNRGYVGFGSESLDPTKLADAKEAFNIGRDPEPDEQDRNDQPSRGRNQWPDMPEFRDVMSRYYNAMRSLSERLHEAIAVDLGLEPGYFAPFVTHPLATLRLLHYPPHPGIFDGNRYGAGAHTDYGNITLLSQDTVGGLEVRQRDGEWIAARPVENAFICNIGDCLMRWSNDIYVSTPHRVVNRGGRERFSVAFFFDPNPDALVECLPTCMGPDRPPLYPPITAAAHLRERLDATYAHRQKS